MLLFLLVVQGWLWQMEQRLQEPEVVGPLQGKYLLDMKGTLNVWTHGTLESCTTPVFDQANGNPSLSRTGAREALSLTIDF